MADFTTYGVVALEDLYVRREADRELCSRLERFEYCYVLAPRQMGKSSLAVRAAESLRARGVKTVTIDLQPLAGHDSALALWGLVARKLHSELARQGIETPLFSPGTGDEAPGVLWVDHMRDVVLPRVDGGLVIFFDEIDTLLSCLFNTDPFFGSLRALHGQRAAGTFAACLLGVTRPADLVRDTETTPFNVAHAIALCDFSRADSDAFLARLRDAFESPERIVDHAHAWTSGHPYMLQNVLKEATLARETKAEDPSLDDASAKAFVAHIVERRFFGQEEDAVLGVVRRTFEGQDLARETMEALNHYRVLLSDKEVLVAQGPRRDVQEKLRISGLVAFVSEGRRTVLRVRNAIFKQRYDATWVAGLLDRPIYEALAARWMQEDEDEDFLLRGAALDAAEVWLKAQEQAVSGWTAEFVNASRRMAGRGTRRQTSVRRLLGAAAVATVVCVSFWGRLYVKGSEAAQQELKLQVATLQAQRDANDALVKQLEGEIELLKADRAMLQARVDQGNKDLELLKVERSNLEKQISAPAPSSEQDRKSLGERLKANESRIVATKDELDRAKKELQASHQYATDLTSSIAQLRSQTAEADLHAGKLAPSDLVTQMESLRAQVKELSAKIAEGQARYATCAGELAKARGERDAAIKGR